MEITSSSTNDKQFKQLMDDILTTQNQATNLMVSIAKDAAELKMAFTPEFLQNIRDTAESNTTTSAAISYDNNDNK